MSNQIGAWMAGGNSQEGRHPSDFYETPVECTNALLRNICFPRTIWEPACGAGAISEVLRIHGHEVISSDVNDYGYGKSGVNFLEADEAEADAVITNPPFKLAAQFIEKIHDLNIHWAALFLKAQYWHAASRYDLFIQRQPAYILPMTWRPDFTGKGQATMDCMWCVWHGDADETIYKPIKRVR